MSTSLKSPLNEPGTTDTGSGPGKELPNLGDGPIRRLYRSRQDRILAGVAGGLGQYFGVDPVLVRLGLVLLTVTSGVGLVAYIILAIVVPEHPAGEEEPVARSSADTHRARDLLGYGFLGLGLFLLAGNLGLFYFLNWGRYWPTILVLIGVLLLVSRGRDDASKQS